MFNAITKCIVSYCYLVVKKLLSYIVLLLFMYSSFQFNSFIFMPAIPLEGLEGQQPLWHLKYLNNLMINRNLR